MKKVLLPVFCLWLIFGIASNSRADTRSYVWTYEYMTLPKGLTEVEYYLTAQVPDTNKTNINTWKHWLELEYGITNRWDVAMYQMWKHKNTASGSASEYDGFKVRTRYRFGDKGEYFVDPELYFEYIRDDDLSKPNVGEAKLILAKDIGKLNISYNQIWERALEGRGKTENEYAVGLSYELWPALKLGMESKGSYNEREYTIGPSISWANSRFWVSLGAAFGLNERSDDLQTRMIAGIPF
jgi:hypothetical protein